jgi:peptidoglycan hydrolase CwlO-like protein
MNNDVKNEFYLSLVSVGKWLLLAFGIFGLLYWGISLAYYKIYYHPHVAKYEINITELENHKRKRESKLKDAVSNKRKLQERIDELSNDQIPDTKIKLKKADEEAEKLGISLVDTITVGKDMPEDAKEVLKAMDETNEYLVWLEDELDGRKSSLDDKIEEISDLNEEIKILDRDIEEEKLAKERVETGLAGILRWFFGILPGI